MISPLSPGRTSSSGPTRRSALATTTRSAEWIPGHPAEPGLAEAHYQLGLVLIERAVTQLFDEAADYGYLWWLKSFGSGDKKVQAYCFRMCLTQVPENRVAFPKPAAYDPKEYELLLRIFAAGCTNEGRSSRGKQLGADSPAVLDSTPWQARPKSASFL
jgi:hypothetical protein